MKKGIILLFLVLINNIVLSKDNGIINLVNFKEFNISLNNELIFFKIKNKTIDSTSIKNSLFLTINSAEKVFKLNEIYFNFDLTESEINANDFYRTNNRVIEIMPISDYALIVNNYTLSKYDTYRPLRSLINSEKDSICCDGSFVYPSFSPGKHSSNILNRRRGVYLLNQEHLRIQIIEDLVFAYEIKKVKDSDWDSYVTWQKTYQIKGKEISFLKEDLVSDWKIDPMKILSDNVNTYSNEVDNFNIINSKYATIKTHDHWEVIQYNFSQVGYIPAKQSIISGIDSLTLFPFFNNAFIVWKQNEMFLYVTHSLSNNFDRYLVKQLIIKNYFAKGRDTSLDQEVIVFSKPDNEHLVILHHNGRYHGFHHFENSSSPLESPNFKFHIVSDVPSHMIELKNTFANN